MKRFVYPVLAMLVVVSAPGLGPAIGPVIGPASAQTKDIPKRLDSTNAGQTGGQTAGPATGQTSGPTAVPTPAEIVGPVPVPVQPAEAVTQDVDVEAAFWDSVSRSDDPMLYLAYLERYPNGAFRVLARNQLNDLWDRATRAFALLEEMGVALDDPTTPSPRPATAVTPETPVTPVTPVTVAPPADVIPVPTEPPEVPTPQRVRNTQNQLRKHGCYTGRIDGVWGDGSQRAMRRFNRRAGTSYSVGMPEVDGLNHMRTLTKAGTRICQ